MGDGWNRIDGTIRNLVTLVSGVAAVLGFGIRHRSRLETGVRSALKLNERVKAEAFKRGLAGYPMGGTIDGKRGDHYIIAPPYIVTASEIDTIVDRLGRRSTSRSPPSANVVAFEAVAPAFHVPLRRRREMREAAQVLVSQYVSRKPGAEATPCAGL